MLFTAEKTIVGQMLVLPDRTKAFLYCDRIRKLSNLLKFIYADNNPLALTWLFSIIYEVIEKKSINSLKGKTLL